MCGKGHGEPMAQSVIRSVEKTIVWWFGVPGQLIMNCESVMMSREFAGFLMATGFGTDP